MRRSFTTQRMLESKLISWSSLASCLLIILVAGCWTEVPFEEDGGKASSSENDLSEVSDGEVIVEGTDDSIVDEESLFGDSSEGNSHDPSRSDELNETYLADDQETDKQPEQLVAESTPANSSDSLLPWQTVDKPDETPELFSKSKLVTPEPIEPKVEESTEPNSPAEESEDGFGNFLAEQYKGLLSESEAPEIEAEEPKSEVATDPKPSAPAQSEPVYSYQPSPLPGSLKIPELKKPRSKDKATREAPESVTNAAADDLSFQPIDPQPISPPQPITPVPTNPESLANTSPQEEELATDSQDEERFAETSEDQPMPWDRPIEPIPDATVKTIEPIVGERYQDDPSEQNPIATLTPKAPTIVEAESPRLASLDPLPAVPVLRYNTRHLAWLLGGKLGLARLAELEGATPSEVAQWTAEVNRLAKQLEVPIPSEGIPSESVGQRVKALLDSAAEASNSMAAEHGTEHAALLEISLKTNALLVMCKKYPELAAPTARAVEKAAERAELPGFLWRDMTKQLLTDSTPDEIFEAVTQMHDNVESYLR